MKTLLGCLMCVVFTISQSSVIAGGFLGGGGQVTVTGAFAGVLIPTVADNSIALFTLNVPNTGLANGTTAVFRNGFFYSGTIQGSADPDSAKLTAILNSTFTENVASVTTTSSGTTTITLIELYSANGQFSAAKIVPNTSVTSAASARIKGKALLTYVNTADDPSGTGDVTYKISGFKQAQATQ